MKRIVFLCISGFLQILSSLDIILPLHTIFAMFKLGVKCLQMIELTEEQSASRENNLTRSSPTDNLPPPLSPDKEQPVAVETFEVYERETELVPTCYIMMLDLCLKQV